MPDEEATVAAVPSVDTAQQAPPVDEGDSAESVINDMLNRGAPLESASATSHPDPVDEQTRTTDPQPSQAAPPPSEPSHAEEGRAVDVDYSVLDGIDPEVVKFAIDQGATVTKLAEYLTDDRDATLALIRREMATSPRPDANGQTEAKPNSPNSLEAVNAKHDKLISDAETELREKATDDGKADYEIEEMVGNQRARLEMSRDKELSQADAEQQSQRAQVEELDRAADTFITQHDPEGKFYGVNGSASPTQLQTRQQLKDAVMVFAAGLRHFGQTPNTEQIMDFVHRSVSSDPTQIRKQAEADLRRGLKTRTGTREIPPASRGSGATTDDLSDQSVLAARLNEAIAGNATEMTTDELFGRARR